ncbi:MAG: helix-turn-helix domain-containing protein [Pseudomonadota bacterium]|nr:MAG: hypothetical protein DIU74_04485 [Pseudomonadota bacterium]
MPTSPEQSRPRERTQLWSDDRALSHALFDFELLPAPDRFDVWRETVLPLFESITDQPPEQFHARVESYDLRHIVMAMSAFSPLRFQRDRRHGATDKGEHLLVQLYLEGGYIGHNGYREIRVRPGDISLLDLGRELETRAQASNALSVVIPREQIYPYINPERLSYGSVLRGETALGRVLANHLYTIWQQLPRARAGECEHINHLLLSSIVGAFTAMPAESVGAMPEQVSREAIRAYIAQHLPEPLTPELLCKRFGCSRAQLYRLFQPFGGVAAYIRDARLNRCWQELSRDDNRPKRIGDIALRWGFSSQSHFNRLFREAFGLSPGEVVEQARSERQMRDEGGTRGYERPRPALYELLRRL